MQDISIVICEEDQEIVERSNLNFVDIVMEDELRYENEGAYPWLDSIDPYANTTFNQLQVVYFIKDLERLKPLVKIEANNQLIDEIIAFASKILPENIHSQRYLKFIGD